MEGGKEVPSELTGLGGGIGHVPRCGFRQISGVLFDHKMLAGTTFFFISHFLSKIEVTFPGCQAMMVTAVCVAGRGRRTSKKMG